MSADMKVAIHLCGSHSEAPELGFKCLVYNLLRKEEFVMIPKALVSSPPLTGRLLLSTSMPGLLPLLHNLPEIQHAIRTCHSE